MMDAGGLGTCFVLGCLVAQGHELARTGIWSEYGKSKRGVCRRLLDTVVCYGQMAAVTIVVAVFPYCLFLAVIKVEV
jgi:hypothetical protein